MSSPLGRAREAALETCRKISETTKEAQMGYESTIRQSYDQVNAGNVEGFMALIADDMVEHEVVAEFPPTKEGVRQFFTMWLAAFPDLHMEPEDVISSGDKVVARVRITGTHSGEFMGMPATGKAVDFEGIDIVRFNDEGLCVEHWGVTDVMSMMQQLGVVPEGAPA
jgi:steroid delta-isomerase-like uncharacterized protein